MEFLLYGAYGYTGKLITEMAASIGGLKPVLAGRNAKKLEVLADQYGYESLVLGLDDKAALEAALQRFPLVLHAAGPFKYTARPMMEACLATGTHYMDITGEIETFELAHGFSREASAKNIMMMPGVGFDVVPTDCLAAFLKAQLPDAQELKLAYATLKGGISRGTAMTMAEAAGEGSARRINGKITRVPLGEHTMTVDFGPKSLFVMSIPWGDVSTAYYTTGIPNVEVYSAVHPKTYKKVKWQKYLGWFLRLGLVKNQIRKQARLRPAGPSAERRAAATSLIWGQVKNASGASKTARLQTLDGYTLTATTSLMITSKVLEGNFQPGFQTPAGCYGADLIMEVKESRRELL